VMAVITDSAWQPMLDNVRMSACKPAPPLGSLAAKDSTIGGDWDIETRRAAAAPGTLMSAREGFD